MPYGGLHALQTCDPLDIIAKQYDLVCNGVELSSGAIRNHQPEVMYEAFRIVGYAKDVVEEKFGHMIAAFRFGAPPHGGIAPGIDRLVRLYADEPNLREVIMFPMNQQAQESMVGSPAPVSSQQLEDLHLQDYCSMHRLGKSGCRIQDAGCCQRYAKSMNLTAVSVLYYNGHDVQPQ